MTSLIKKISNINYQISNSQQGVTMLLALLTLSAILAISFSLATILLLEIRSSGDLLRSEASLYASTGISEQSAFNLKRHVTCNTACTYITNFSNNVTLSGQPVVSSTSTPTFHDQVTPNSTFSNNSKVYIFCGPSNVGNCNYGKVTLSYLSSGNNDPLYIYLCQYDSTLNPNTAYGSVPCTDPTQHITSTYPSTYWITTSNGDAADSSLTYGTKVYSSSGIAQTTWSVSNSSLNPNLQQELILFNSGATGPIDVSVETFGADGVTPVGLPYVGQTSVTVNTQNGDVGRKVQVLLPVSNGNAVAAGAATHFSVVAPVSVTAGISATGTVIALDSNNNIATGYTGTVHFTSTDGAWVPPTDYPFVAADNGAKTFTFTLKTLGSQTITATDKATGSINGSSNSISVLSGSFGFKYYRTITIPSSQISNTVAAGFTVLVSYADPSLKQVPAGHVQNSNGYDIVFAKDSSCGSSNFLNWETELYSSVTGQLRAWVKMPSALSSSSNTTFYMCYGNSNISSFQGGALGSAWDGNYVGVWHFPNGTTLSTNDSTAGANNGTLSSSQPTATFGLIDGGVANANGQYIDVGDPASFNMTSALTLSGWAKSPGYSAYENVLEKPFNTINQGLAPYHQYSLQTNTSGHITASVTTSGTNYTATGGTALSTNTWYYFAGTYDGSNIKVYLNGTQDGITAHTGAIDTDPTDLGIGASIKRNTEYWNGSLDEVHISNVARSADWIKTEYNNQFLPASFCVVGAEQQ